MSSLDVLGAIGKKDILPFQRFVRLRGVVPPISDSLPQDRVDLVTNGLGSHRKTCTRPVPVSRNQLLCHKLQKIEWQFARPSVLLGARPL
jgi:hypothetical protein